MKTLRDRFADRTKLTAWYFADALAKAHMPAILAAAQVRDISRRDIVEHGISIVSARQLIKELKHVGLLNPSGKTMYGKPAQTYHAPQNIELVFDARKKSLELLTEDRGNVFRDSMILCKNSAGSRIDWSNATPPNVTLSLDSLTQIYHVLHLRILAAAANCAKDAHNISKNTDIPITSCYRALNNLKQNGLVFTVDSFLTREGKRKNLLTSNVNRIDIRIHGGDYVVKIDLTYGTPLVFRQYFVRQPVTETQPNVLSHGPIEEELGQTPPAQIRATGGLAELIAAGLGLLAENFSE